VRIEIVSGEESLLYLQRQPSQVLEVEVAGEGQIVSDIRFKAAKGANTAAQG